VRIVF
jgi:hypothetical protein